MAKAKVVVTIAGDAYKIAQNIWKAISGSAHVKRIPSNSANLKNAKNLSSTNAAKTQINTARLQQGLRQQADAKTAEKLKRAGEKIDLKSRYLKNGKPKPKTKTTNGTKTSSTTKKSPFKAKPKTKTTPEPPKTTFAQADIAKGIKITPKNATVGRTVWKGTKKVGNIVTKGGKKFIQTRTGQFLALGSAGAAGYYLGRAIDKSIAGTNGAATTSSGAATTTKPKPPKPSGPVTTAPAPPSQLPSSPNGKKPKPPKADYPGAGLHDTEDRSDRGNVAKPKTFEQKLKAKWVERRGGEPAFGKKGSDAAWKTHVYDMRRGSEVGLTYKDTQDYDKIIEERKELASATKKKRGGVIKRNKGGPVRGVGKALRGFGNNSIYSNKMY